MDNLDQFFEGEKRLNVNQLVQIMEQKEHAYKEIKSAQSTYKVAMIFSYAGGWPIGTAIFISKRNEL